MKVLKVLGIVFGILLLLTGGGLLAGSFAAGKGDDAVQRQMQSSGLVGPVQGTITEVDGQNVTVAFTDQQGQSQTGSGQAALTKPAEVGDTVSIYYSSDDPSIIVATDILGGSLAKVAGTLRTAGIICLILGGLLLLGGIIGLVVGKKAAPALPPGSGYPPQAGPQQYPPQQNQPGQAYPPQQNQPGQAYPPQQNQPGQAYPPQPSQPPSWGQYPGPQQYPAPPTNPPQPGPQQYPPPNYPPQGPPSAR